MNEMNEIKEEKMKQKQNRKEEMLEYFQLIDPKKGNVIGIYRPIYTECDGYLSPHKMDLDDEWGRKDMKDLDLSFLKDHLKKIRSVKKKLDLREKLQKQYISSFSVGQSFGAYAHGNETIQEIINDEDTWFIVRSWIQQVVQQQHEKTLGLVIDHLIDVMGLDEDWKKLNTIMKAQGKDQDETIT